MVESALLKNFKGYIGGKWVDSAGGKSFESVNPSNREKLADLPLADERDVTVLGPAVHLDEGGFAPGSHTPAFGSEARAILAWAGFAERDVQRLLDGGALTPTR